jgi:hypothetical protein
MAQQVITQKMPNFGDHDDGNSWIIILILGCPIWYQIPPPSTVKNHASDRIIPLAEWYWPFSLIQSKLYLD